MSTSARIKVFDEEDRLIVTIYKHWDGCPEGLGRDLEEFLKERKVINGIPAGISEEDYRFANGMHELAAQLVTYLKSKYPAGDVYLVPEDVGHWYYTYEVKYSGLDKPARLKVYSWR